ncbi:hypothetical protein KUTeg_018973 [Tegillarca granosa]|uniref:Uncharacterized protein n=1 Tax=Tegillarca granosa TaxID=220873 RepID=A0ABQ9EG74_TEGGR|nr:hypothetical protein KUTeg_018973 [Tegillarca granosa]
MDEADEREIEKLKRDRKRAEKKDNLKEVAQLCNCIGELLAKHGKWEEAIAEHETELGLSEALNDTIGSAVASRKLGECYCGLENYGKALQLQQRHLSLAVACKDTLEEQRAWATIGRTYLFMCDTTKNHDELLSVSKKAEDAFRKSLDVCEQLKSSTKISDYMEMKARLFLNLGLVFDGRGDLKQCAEFMKQAIKISEQHNLHCDLYRCHFSLSGIYSKGGNLKQASQQLDSALKCAQKLKDKFLESETLTSKALVSLSGHLDSLLAQLAIASTICKVTAKYISFVIHVSMQLKKYSHAKHYLKKAHKLGATTAEEAERIVKLFKSGKHIAILAVASKARVYFVFNDPALFSRVGVRVVEVGSYEYVANVSVSSVSNDWLILEDLFT